MTERLYYSDAYLSEFEGKVVNVQPQGKLFATTLDRSAFYPTSGGQLHDTGNLNGVAVIDVIETDSGEVNHITETVAWKDGSTLTGSLNMNRRRRHRQAHTAQHILSAVSVQLGNYVTMSVHLGEEYSAVELDQKEITPELLARMERQANDIVASEIPIRVELVPADQVAKLPLRKPASRAGELRVITIEGVDCSACGGTHCRNTGGVDLIKIIGTEKIRGRTQILFLAGDLAREDYAARFEVTNQVSKELTCHFSDLPDKINKLTAEGKNLKRRLSEVEKELLPARINTLAQQKQIIEGLSFVAARMPQLDPGNAGVLATAAAERIGGVVLLLCDSRLVIGSIGEGQLHAGQLAKAMSTKTGLKGGGNNKLAQLGGAVTGQLEDYVGELLAIIGQN